MYELDNPKFRRVLDHGFAFLVDVMGDDAAICQAARVSYGAGTKTVREDRGLIRYLFRHGHTSPLEQAEAKFHLRVPIFVARQLLRHRTACLSGDSLLYFDLPGSIVRNHKHSYKVSIRDFYQRWHNGLPQKFPPRKWLKQLDKSNLIEEDKWYDTQELSCITGISKARFQATFRRHAIGRKVGPRWLISGREWKDFVIARSSGIFEQTLPMQDRLRKQQLRMCDELTGVIEHTTVTDIWQSGTRPVYEVTLENGYSIKMTKDHLCLTDRGWSTLQQAVNLSIDPTSNEVRSWDVNSAKFAVNGVLAYQSCEWLKFQMDEGLCDPEIAAKAGCSPSTVKRYRNIYGLSYTLEQKGSISSRKQSGRTRPSTRGRRYTQEHRAKIGEARSGSRSNFWRGGVHDWTPRRSTEYNNWKRNAIKNIGAEFGFCCQVCGNRQFVAHHIDPFWNNPDRLMDETNIVLLCREHHNIIHSKNLELLFRDHFFATGDAKTFYEGQLECLPPMAAKGLKRRVSHKLARTYVKVKTIRLAGEEMTYDLSVAGPFRNFVSNGFIVHNSVNEYSARYSIIADEYYVPEAENIQPQSTDNKQGRTGGLSETSCDGVQWFVETASEHAYDVYRVLLGERTGKDPAYPHDLIYDPYSAIDSLLDDDFPGIARELARIVLPVNYYTELYWKQDLHNLLHLLKLRCDPHTQYETRMVANAMYDLIKPRFSLTCEAWEDYQRDAITLSRMEIQLVRNLLTNVDLTTIDPASYGLTKREMKEFLEHFGSQETSHGTRTRDM